ncbi:hypothetical protein EUGRSUZ_H02585 [Eucalyptus grandis]|uniref:Uncharacterized protein n=2 Tax=Eucalyptus grandis TaxID=71139 RepID=A0ACC3JSC0_EUCGR|nr:hypothetical protein EUGRSUZ_H02585 [Eucalyptus grandis]
MQPLTMDTIPIFFYFQATSRSYSLREGIFGMKKRFIVHDFSQTSQPPQSKKNHMKNATYANIDSCLQSVT